MGGVAAVVPGLLPQAVRAVETARAQGAVVHEPARNIPVAEHADVVVCGGGPAGVAAAVGAARKGAKALLLEQHGCLGGFGRQACCAGYLIVTTRRG